MSNALAGTVGQAADDDLVVRARKDRGAFATLYERYYPRVFRYCVRRLYVRDVAEDVVANVFVRIASHLPGFGGSTETDFRRWLFGIASNAVNAHLRQTKRRQELWEAATRNRSLARVADKAVAVDAILDWPTVYQAILELEPREQTS
jgi:RNA polymerase sigma factor (sigma-70 family)